MQELNIINLARSTKNIEKAASKGSFRVESFVEHNRLFFNLKRANDRGRVNMRTIIIARENVNYKQIVDSNFESMLRLYCA